MNMRTEGSVVRWAGSLGLLLLLGTWGEARAQQTGSITGRIADETGAPLGGAQVNVEGTDLGGLSNAQGRYLITGVPVGPAVVRVTLLGYSSRLQEVTVTAGSAATVDFDLAVEALELAGIVAVGYGTQRKVNLSGAVASVSAEEMAKLPVPTVSQALQGLSPGLQVVDQGGSPGRNGTNIKVRGIGTLSSATNRSDNRANPLVLVDGVEGTMDVLDVEDIASVSVLKDASSAAIYGSRAANGVILITTKRAAAREGVEITYDGYFGRQDITTFPEEVSVGDHMRLTNVSYVNSGREPKYSDEYMQMTLSGEDPINYPTTDWVDVIYDPAPIQDHTLRVSGGSPAARFALSANFMNEDGLMANTGAKRYGARLNTDFTVSDRLTAGLDIAGSRRSDIEPADFGYVTFFLIHDTPPTVTAEYPDGTYGWSDTNRNPLAAAEASGQQERAFWQGTVTGRANYDLVPEWVQLQTLASVRYDHGKDTEFFTQQRFYDYFDDTRLRGSWGPNRLSHNSWDDLQTTLRALLDYGHVFGGAHDVSGVIGYEQIHQDLEAYSAARSQFWNNDVRTLPFGDPSTRDNGGSLSEWALRSVFGRLNYSYQGRYLLEGNFRYDGSSRFAEGNRFGFFPSFSAAWRISEESFFNVGWIDELKLRGSWGQLGNQDVGLYQYYSTISLTQPYWFGGGVQTGAAKTSLTNPDITWETTTVTDVGFDAAFLSGRLSLTADYYVRETKDILLSLPIMDIVGRNPATVNAGVVENKGWELEVGWQDQAGEVRYSVDFNLSDNKNKVVDVVGTGPYLDDDIYATLEGYPIWSYYGYEALGLFQSQEEIDNWATQESTLAQGTVPGDIKWKDQNGDGVIGPDDRVPIGSDLPHYSFGLNLAASWGAWDAGAFLSGVGKQDRYIYLGLVEGPVWENFTTEWHLDYWSEDNRDARVPAPYLYHNYNTRYPSSWWLTDAKYVKLRNLQLGYTLPATLSDRLGIQRLRVYVAGKNLWQWTAMEIGLDPEVPTRFGNYYPQTKSFSIGTNISF
jgi:TonB-linked SusC/RagA family outer membrane protein